MCRPSHQHRTFGLLYVGTLRKCSTWCYYSNAIQMHFIICQSINATLNEVIIMFRWILNNGQMLLMQVWGTSTTECHISIAFLQRFDLVPTLFRGSFVIVSRQNLHDLLKSFRVPLWSQQMALNSSLAPCFDELHCLCVQPGLATFSHFFNTSNPVVTGSKPPPQLELRELGSTQFKNPHSTPRRFDSAHVKGVNPSLASANVSSRLEPSGVYRADRKCPDGVSLIPWMERKFLVWDPTCVDTFCVSQIRIVEGSRRSRRHHREG